MEEQIEHAITVASDPRSEQSLKAQAFEFLQQLRTQRDGWSLCFSLVVREPPLPEVVRLVSLDIVNNAVRTKQLESADLMAVSSNLFGYVEKNYGANINQSVRDPVSIQNKVTQTITQLFMAMYQNSWPSFFNDISRLRTTSGSNLSPNGPGTIMYLRILIEIHDQIADPMVPKSPEEQKNDMLLKDLIRERDIVKISTSWHEILAHWRGKQDTIVELCLSCIGRWVVWTDITLAIDDFLLNLLFELLRPDISGDQGQKVQENREAAIETFVDILGKKMGAGDKLQLIEVLRVNDAITQLVNGRLLSQQRHTPDYDTDLAEDVAKLVNATVVDIVKAIDTGKQDITVFKRGTEQIKNFLPHVLRFLSDEYDEICSTVIPCLTDLLALMRKHLKVNDAFVANTSFVLPLILDSVITKVKYDETADWGNEDTQTDEAEFQELRKRLHILQQAIAAVDEDMYNSKITQVVISTFDVFQNHNGQIDWRDLELALHQMYLFGDHALKHGGLYSKTKPVTPVAEQLIQMLFRMMQTDVASAVHPSIQLQFMELSVRYSMFFEANPQYITRVLEYYITFVHHNHPKVKLRSWYLLQRFVKHVKSHIGNIAETVIGALSDLLSIKAEVPQDDSDNVDEDDSSSTDGQSANARFTSQLYLFETIGCVSSVKAVPSDSQVLLLRSIIDPIFLDMERYLNAAVSGQKQAQLQIHHLIMALGTVARGFSEWTPSQTASNARAPANEVSQEFLRASEAILVALGQLKSWFDVREAGRFAFSRFIGVLGSRILPQLSRWIENLLTIDSTKDEVALLMRLLDQVVFGFKTEIFDILNTLLTPLLQRVFRGIGETAAGTDDEIQLAELKREYLAFLNVILNNDLEAVLVSEVNQATFTLIISTIEHLASDINDLPTAKLAIMVLIRMIATWGGPDRVTQTNNIRNGANTEGASKSQLQGFDQFMMTRFSPLCWSLPSNSNFDFKDAQGKLVLGEAALLQKAIYSKTGQDYLEYLQTVELSGMGMDASSIEEYLGALSSMDQKGFQKYFKDLVQRSAR